VKILVLHNSYRHHGGEDESFAAEVRMLRDAGHFVETIHLKNHEVTRLGSIDIALQSIWSQSSFDLVDRTLRENSFDVLHVQNFFPLISPSVYAAARRRKVAVVQSLRNYRLLCPGVSLYRDGHLCEDCLHKTMKYPAVIHRCYRESAFASAAVAAMVGLHSFRGTWKHDVDVYISLSESSRAKFVEAGFPPDKVIVKSNFVHPDPGPGDGKGEFVLFAGRLIPEKGIQTLLAAWSIVDSAQKLTIVGDGPLAPLVQDFCRRTPNAQYLGARSTREVYELMGSASLVVFPSEWYEPFGRVAIESFAKGTPVVASDFAAMTEIVHDGHDGLLFRCADPHDLAAKINNAFANPSQLQAMRRAARQTFEQRFSAAQNCEQLLSAYEHAQHIAASSRNTQSAVTVQDSEVHKPKTNMPFAQLRNANGHRKFRPKGIDA
jgi:glycosyltransferase involved in cell wall biosynthesis